MVSSSLQTICSRLEDRGGWYFCSRSSGFTARTTVTVATSVSVVEIIWFLLWQDERHRRRSPEIFAIRRLQRSGLRLSAEMPIAGDITRDFWQMRSRFFQSTNFNRAESCVNNGPKRRDCERQIPARFQRNFKHLTQHGSINAIFDIQRRMWASRYKCERRRTQRESRTAWFGATKNLQCCSLKQFIIVFHEQFMRSLTFMVSTTSFSKHIQA